MLDVQRVLPTQIHILGAGYILDSLSQGAEQGDVRLVQPPGGAAQYDVPYRSIVSAANLYGGTYTMFDAILPDLGITTRFADIRDPE